MSRIEIRNKNHVVALDRDGRMVAEARRPDPEKAWDILALVERRCENDGVPILQACVLVNTMLNEVRQRKLVLAILKELSR
jgi:formylmethanofuran dehydrogenase subunit E